MKTITKTITKIEPSAVRTTAAKPRVAAYCRVSTKNEEQLLSLEAQKTHYEEKINDNPEWEFAGVYYDEGISGTKKEKRPALLRMIADCEAGKIDKILTKSLSRFARKTTDCLVTGKLICGECGVTFKRHINSVEGLKYPVWVCKGHLGNAMNCPMKFIRERHLECAFITMMNKLIFARKEILQELIDCIWLESHKKNLLRIDEIDSKLEKNVEKQQTLRTLMARGYIEPPLFTEESNEIAREAEALTAEKNQLEKEVSENMSKTEELNALLKYTKNAKIGCEFDGNLVLQFLDYATVHSREEIIEIEEYRGIFREGEH